MAQVGGLGGSVVLLGRKTWGDEKRPELAVLASCARKPLWLVCHLVKESESGEW